MPSRSSATASRTPPARRAFSLLEVLVVVVIVGLLAALASVAIAPSTEAAQRRAMTELTTLLLTARLDAMQTAAPVEARVWATQDGDLHAVAGRREREWRGVGLAPIPPDPAAEPLLAGVFEPTGRTRARQWSFGDPARSDTLWEVRFDPISGVARLERTRDAEDR